MNRLAGKVGVVTGAAGGIGAAAVRAFVAEGAHVGLIDRPGVALEKLAAELAGSVTARRLARRAAGSTRTVTCSATAAAPNANVTRIARRQTARASRRRPCSTN